VSKRPDQKDYHLSDGKCPPLKENRGCYGDCMDCYSRDLEDFERREICLEN